FLHGNSKNGECSISSTDLQALFGGSKQLVPIQMCVSSARLFKTGGQSLPAFVGVQMTTAPELATQASTLGRSLLASQDSSSFLQDKFCTIALEWLSKPETKTITKLSSTLLVSPIGPSTFPQMSTLEFVKTQQPSRNSLSQFVDILETSTGRSIL